MRLVRVGVAVLCAVAARGEGVTFGRDVAPIVYKSCAPCHRAGEAGPFSLLTYQDVKKHARQIAVVTGSRYMPPWLPEAGYGDFTGEQRLSDGQIRTIAEWVKEGAAEGEAAEAPPEFSEGWQLGKPDLVVEAEKAYSLPASGPDVFWNFVFSPKVTGRRWVRAIEIRPGDKRNVHHANVMVDRARSSRAKEIAPGAGFPGMDLTVERETFDIDGHFLYWKPGAPPYVEPKGLAWRLDPGNDLVLNTHLKCSGKPEEVKPSIGLYFTDQPQTKFPVLVQLEHDGALDIPAGDADFVVTDHFKMPMDADILAVYPHAHYLGKRMEGYATLPDGKRKWLVRIEDWDATWEAVYYYREPVFLPKGTVISMRFSYDNSEGNPRNPHRPPVRVRAGNRTTDEMGHLWLQVLPRGSGDRRMELEEALMRRRLEKYPGDFWARMKLGGVMMARLDTAGAEQMLEQAVRLQPENPEAHNLLGSALQRLGRQKEAIEQFRAAVRYRPDYGNARYNLALALVRAGKLGEATENFRKVAEAFPEDAMVWASLGELLNEQGRYAEALEVFEKAMKLNPTLEPARRGAEAAREHVRGH